MSTNPFRQQAIALRKRGKTYSEISHALGKRIPKGTISYWLHNVPISLAGQRRRNRLIMVQLRGARKNALKANRKIRERYFRTLREQNMCLLESFRGTHVRKLMLAILYIAEGSKAGSRHASVILGNSDHRIIRMFLSLLRKCYTLDEQKFRCTVQCRADMDTQALETYWSRITHIPLRQFYPARIDPRTIGKASKKKKYKGVCRVQYFSANIFHELMTIFEMISEVTT